MGQSVAGKASRVLETGLIAAEQVGDNKDDFPSDFCAPHHLDDIPSCFCEKKSKEFDASLLLPLIAPPFLRSYAIALIHSSPREEFDLLPRLSLFLRRQ